MASLTVSADYERKFKTKLVTRYTHICTHTSAEGNLNNLFSRLIHPQNRAGEPIMNPNGRYFVSFNLNGCRRKVL